jgi:hypothetical protein
MVAMVAMIALGLAGLLFAVVMMGFLLLMGLIAAAVCFHRKLLALLLVGAVAVGLVMVGSKAVRVRHDFGEMPEILDLSPPLQESIAPPPMVSPRRAEAQVGVAAAPPPSDEAASNPPAPSRPAWVDRPRGLRGDVYEQVVCSELYATVGECQRQLEAAEAAAVAEYLDDFLGPGAGQRVTLDPDFIRKRLVSQQFHETVQSSVGTMQQAFALLAIDGADREELRTRWRSAMAFERLLSVGGAAALTLGVLAAAFSYLVTSNRRAAGPLASSRPV